MSTIDTAPAERPGLTRARVMSALSWTAALSGATTVLVFVRGVVTARLLTPADYGIFGLCLTVSAGLAALTNVSFASSVITREFADARERDRVLNAVWTADLGRQILTTAVLLAIAAPAGRFLGDPRVSEVLSVTAFVPAIMGFSNIGLMLLRKGMEFRAVAAHKVVSEVTTTVITIAVAWIYRNVWALVISQLASVGISAALSYVFAPHRPKFTVDRAALAASWGFSRSMFVIGLLTYVTTQFDGFIIHRFAGAATLGAYLVAYRLANLLVDVLSDVLTPVVFPAVAALKSADDSKRLDRAVLQMVLVSFACTGVATLALSLGAPQLVALLYGEKWRAAAPILSLLAFLALFRGLARFVSPILMGMNRADLDMKAKIVEALLFVPLTYVLIQRSGAIGAAYAGIITYALAALNRIVFAARLVPEARGTLLKGLGRIAAVLAACYVAGFWLIAAGVNGLIVTAAFLAVGGVGAAAAEPIVWRVLRHGVASLRARFA